MPMKSEAASLLLQNQAEMLSLGDALLKNPELGFKEFETNKIITSYLTELGIPFENHISVTGVRATLGTGGYHIALVADMDAVGVASNGGITACHSCGHSIQVTVMLAVLAALHRGGFVNKLGGRVSFIAAPAEEYIDLDYRAKLQQEGKIKYFSGKQNMIADGVFDDVDCALSIHITGEPGVKLDVGSTLAGFAVKKAVFTGVGAHSGALAHQGRNALHAATLCLQACAFLQEQFPTQAGLQLHPILSEGGISMNVIPERAVLETYVRANTNEYLFEATQKFDTAARSCAAALGIECAIENTVGYMPLRQSAKLNKVVYQNMLDCCSADTIAQGFVSGASGDIGDLGFLLPSVQFGFSGFSGRIHSDTFAISDPEHAYLHTAEILLGTIIDLLADPTLQDKNPNFAQDKDFYLKNWLMQH